MIRFWLPPILFFLPLFLHATIVKDSDPMSTRRSVDSLVQLAKVYCDKDLEQSGRYGFQAFRLATGISYLEGKADALHQIALYYTGKKNYVKAIYYRFELVNLCQKINDKDRLLESYLYLSSLFIIVENLDNAKKYLDLSARLSPYVKSHGLLGTLYVNRASYSAATNDYKAALTFLFLSLKYYSLVKSDDDLGRSYKTLADIYTKLKNYPVALLYYRKSYEKSLKTSNQSDQAIILTRIAHVFQITNMNDSNLKYNLRALEIRKKIDQKFLIPSSCFNTGEAHWLLGNKDSARYYFKLAIIDYRNVGTPYLLEGINRQLSVFAAQEGDFISALSYYKAANEYRNAKDRDRMKNEIAILEARLALAKNQSNIDVLNQEVALNRIAYENRRTQTILYEALFIGLFLLIVVIEQVALKNNKLKKKLQLLNAQLSDEFSNRIIAEGRLKQSEELHRLYAENSSDVITIFDKELHRTFISASCEKFFGYTPHEVITNRISLNLIDPLFRDSAINTMKETFRTQRPSRSITKALHKSGESFWIEVIVNPIIDQETKEIKEIISIARDISGLKKHEDELALNARQKNQLLSEIHNRVKNNFSILSSLMTMQTELSQEQSLTISLKELQLRIRTMSLVHEHLYHSQSLNDIFFDEYLLRLAFIISGSFETGRIRLTTEIHRCFIPIGLALPLGLIVNELMTNAYKYAFPDNAQGTVTIRLYPEKDNIFCLSVSDDGVGLPSDFSIRESDTMGSRIICILVEQIEGTLEIRQQAGTTFEIRFSNILTK